MALATVIITGVRIVEGHFVTMLMQRSKVESELLYYRSLSVFRFKFFEKQQQQNNPVHLFYSHNFVAVVVVVVVSFYRVEIFDQLY